MQAGQYDNLQLSGYTAGSEIRECSSVLLHQIIEKYLEGSFIPLYFYDLDEEVEKYLTKFVKMDIEGAKISMIGYSSDEQTWQP